MKRILFLVLLLATTILYSQNTDNEKGLISLGTFFSPNYSYRHIERDADMGNLLNDVVNDYSKPVFGFNAGLQIFFNVNTFLNIESGAEFYQQRNGYLNIPIADMDDYDVVYGYVDSYYMHNYISLPVKFNFKVFRKNKFYAGTSVGFSTNFFIYARIVYKTKYNDFPHPIIERNNVDVSNVYKINFDFRTSIYMVYQLNDAWDLKFEPIFRYSLKSIFDAPIKQYNYTLGGQISMIYNFKKSKNEN